MTTSKIKDSLYLLTEAFYFFKKHAAIIMSLALVAALGRVIQLGGFGKISSGLNVALELIIESARVLIFLFVLGLASVKNGILRTKTVFSSFSNWKPYLTHALNSLKKSWVSLLINFIVFLFIAWILNYLIDALAYQTCLLLQLKSAGMLSAVASEWTILLFFKNLSVIPLTLIFETMLLLWLTGKNQLHPVTPH